MKTPVTHLTRQAPGAAMWMVNIYPRMLVQQVVSGAMRAAPQRFM